MRDISSFHVTNLPAKIIYRTGALMFRLWSTGEMPRSHSLTGLPKNPRDWHFPNHLISKGSKPPRGVAQKQMFVGRELRSERVRPLTPAWSDCFAVTRPNGASTFSSKNRGRFQTRWSSCSGLAPSGFIRAHTVSKMNSVAAGVAPDFMFWPSRKRALSSKGKPDMHIRFHCS